MRINNIEDACVNPYNRIQVDAKSTLINMDVNNNNTLSCYDGCNFLETNYRKGMAIGKPRVVGVHALNRELDKNHGAVSYKQLVPLHESYSTGAPLSHTISKITSRKDLNRRNMKKEG